MNRDDTVFRGGKKIISISLVLAAIGALGLVIGFFVDRRQFFAAYLTAYAYAVSIAAGALVFMMIGHAMHAGWPVLLRRLTETIAGTMPLLCVLFVPLVFGLGALYPWLHPESFEHEHERHLVEFKAPWLNATSFLARSVVYLAILLVASELLLRWSTRKDREPDAPVDRRLNALSVGMLPPVGLAISFAAFDWLMSLTPTWVSSMYPVYYFGGGFLGAIATITILAWAAQRAGLLPGVTSSHYYALGRLLLAFTIFWAYCAYFQFFIIWAADRPEESAYYAVRSVGSFRAVSVALLIVQFALPFAVLLGYRIKRRPGPLAAVAAWLVAAHYIDVHWLVAPSVREHAFPYHWLDLAALLAVGGLCVAFAAFRLRGRAIVPINDPALPEALRYESV